MAADSRCSSGNMLLTHVDKLHRLKSGAIFGSAGDADIRAVVQLLDRVTPRCLPTRAALAALRCSVNGLLAFRGGRLYHVECYWYQTMTAFDAQFIECTLPYSAAGSGREYALGALATGSTAGEAVSAAILFDSASAYPVKELKIRR